MTWRANRFKQLAGKQRTEPTAFQRDLSLDSEPGARELRNTRVGSSTNGDLNVQSARLASAKDPKAGWRAL